MKSGVHHNAKEVIAWLEKLSTALDRRIHASMAQTAVELHAEVAKRAPRSARSGGRSGGSRLAGSFSYGVIRRAGVFVGFCGTNVPYAGFPEFGTKNIYVGTPRGPRRTWAAKRARIRAGIGGRWKDTSMPYFGPSWEAVRGRHERRMQDAGRG